MGYKIGVTACALFFLASFLTSGQVTTNTLSLHSAAASILVSKLAVNTNTECKAPCNHCSLGYSYSLTAEEEQLVSTPVLDEVARRLDLIAKWSAGGTALSPDEVYSMLKSMVQVKQYRETDIISITARSHDPAEAAAIANEVAQVFSETVEVQNRQEKETAQVAADTQQSALDALKGKSITLKPSRPNYSVEILRRADPTPKDQSPSSFVTAKIQNIQKDSEQKLLYATARISVLKRQDDLLECQAPCEHCSLKPSSSLRTETVMIRWSRPVLDAVAAQLDLAEKWAVNGVKPSPDEVYSLLRSKLAVQQVGDTSFIDITAADSDAGEAASIANEVARAYKKYVEEIALKEKQNAEAALASVLKGQEDKVLQAELKYKEFRKKQGLSEVPVVVDKSTEKLRIQQLEEDRVQARVAMLVAKARMEQWAKMESESRVASAAYINDPSISSLHSKIVKITKQLSGVDPDSSVAQQNQADLNELNIQLKSALEEFEKAMVEIYLAAKKEFEALDQKSKEISSQAENPETKKARSEFEIQKSIYEALKKRVSEAPPVAEKPPSCTVEIVSLAESE